MKNLLILPWESPKKALFVATALILLIGGIFLFLAFSSVEAGSREAQIDQLTSSLLDFKDKDESQLKNLARTRKDLLVQEAINNPEGFLRAATLVGKNKDFPSSVQPDLEQEVQIEGNLLVVHFDGKDFTKTDYKLVTKNKEVFDLHFAQNAPSLQTGSTIKVKAIGIDSHLVLEAADGKTQTTSLETLSVASSLSIGETRTAVLLVNFANDASTPVAYTTVNDLVFSGSASVNAYYQENSFNQTSLAGEIFGWYTLSQTNSSCETNYYNWSTEADNLAIASGVNVFSYDRIVYIFPTPAGCAYGGLGTVGGTPGQSWIFNYHTDGRVYAHELGHNIGIHHANSLACGLKAIDVYANCINTEYGDYFDVMGNFWYVSPYMLHFNGAHKVAVGWIPSTRITTATSAGTFRIYSLETASANPQILKISKPDTAESYTISYRQPVGFDIGMPSGLIRGASIHILNDNPAAQTLFLDTTPGTGDFSGFGDATLQDGQKFTDAINNIQILQTSHTSDYAEVQVSFSLADTTAPTVAITYPANGAKVTKNVKITVTANASDNVGVKKVEFRRNGSLICTDTSTPYSCSMFTNRYAGKQVIYQAKAFDAANNYSSSKVTVTTK